MNNLRQGGPGHVFVGGVARSGTSLVQKMLDLHPNIYGGPELGILPPLMATYRRLRTDIAEGKLAVVLDVERARRSYREFVDSLYADRVEGWDCRYISEKTPWNLLAFELLAEVFPAARFVWVIRDPRDVICSLRGVQARARAQEVEGVRLGASIHGDLRYIRRYVEAGEAFERTHGERLCVVYYEDVLAAPRAVADRLSTFLGLDVDEGMLATEQPNDTSEALGAGRTRPSVFYDSSMFDRPIDETNRDKWKRELSRVDLRAVGVHLGRAPLRRLERYQLGHAGAGWPLIFGVTESVSYVAGRLRRR
jgi:hypothetical protein